MTRRGRTVLVFVDRTGRVWRRALGHTYRIHRREPTARWVQPAARLTPTTGE